MLKTSSTGRVQLAPNSDDDDPLSPTFASAALSPPAEHGLPTRVAQSLPGAFSMARVGSREELGRVGSREGLSVQPSPSPDNPTPQLVPPPTHAVTGTIGEKHVLVMVGLPARGKTHMAKRLERYLAFFHGARTKVFNVGEYRRKMGKKEAQSSFFNPLCEQAASQRMEFAQAAVKDMVDFLFQGEADSIIQSEATPAATIPLGDGWSESRTAPATVTSPMRCVDSGRVAIFDATNSTRKRRAWLREQLGLLPIKLLFIESVCTDEAIVDRNIWNSKVVLPEYSNMTPEEAFQDFRNRIEFYRSVYEPMDEEELSWIKLINCGRRVEINNIHGFLLGRIVQFLSNMHNTPHSIYLTRHGQSEYNRVGKIGGDSPITAAGDRYARKLAEFCLQSVAKNDKGERVRARLWTSSLKRTIQTARYIPHPKLVKDGQEWVQMSPRVLRNLDELYAGVCDGMTYAEIEDNYPEEYKMRKEDKLGYRYPRGESYLDVISRLDPLVHELESYSEPVVICGHQAVLRLIYAYFTGKPRELCPRLSIPLNTIIKLTPRTHDCEEERFVMDISDVADGAGAVFGDSVEPPSH